jgi:hypothetical protein
VTWKDLIHLFLCLYLWQILINHEIWVCSLHEYSEVRFFLICAKGSNLPTKLHLTSEYHIKSYVSLQPWCAEIGMSDTRSLSTSSTHWESRKLHGAESFVRSWLPSLQILHILCTPSPKIHYSFHNSLLLELAQSSPATPSHLPPSYSFLKAESSKILLVNKPNIFC